MRSSSTRALSISALCLTAHQPVASVQAAPGGDATVEKTTVHAGAGQPGAAVLTCLMGRRDVGGGVGTTADSIANRVQFRGPLDETGATASIADGDTACSWYANVFNSATHGPTRSSRCARRALTPRSRRTPLKAEPAPWRDGGCQSPARATTANVASPAGMTTTRGLQHKLLPTARKRDYVALVDPHSSVAPRPTLLRSTNYQRKD